MDHLKQIPTEIVYGFIAIGGGVARYLNGYVDGHKFRLSIFLASAAVSGFSGYMFALLGEALNFHYPWPNVFAGCGGFFGEQTMKLIFETISRRSK